jgi:hypothetical protein
MPASEREEDRRLGDAARAALADAEGRWQRERGSAAQERGRLREEIVELNKRLMVTEQENRPSPKRARVDRGANRAEPPGHAALTRTEVYVRFHEAEASARAATERATVAEDQLGRVVSQVQEKLGVHLERSAQLTATSESNARLSERLSAAVREQEAREKEVAELRVEVTQLRSSFAPVSRSSFAPVSFIITRRVPAQRDAALASAKEMAATKGVPTDARELRQSLLREKLSSERRAAAAAKARAAPPQGSRYGHGRAGVGVLL